MLMTFKTHLYIYASIIFALPRISVLTALPPSLRSVIPLCAQTCLDDFIQRDFASSICPDSSNVDCLCSKYGADGYTLGELSFACLSTKGCPETARSNSTAVYSICSRRTNAVTATHKTIIVTATPEPTSASNSDGIMASATMPSSGFTSDPASGASMSAGPGGVKMSGSISLSMAQIAGITIAAAALLILTVGIAACLIFVRKRNRRLEIEDRKVFLYPPPRPSRPHGSEFGLPMQDPQDRLGGGGFIPLQRNRSELPVRGQNQQQWPRYYPIMPDEVGVARSTNIRPISNPGASLPEMNATYGSNSTLPAQLGRQSTGVILPQPPTAAYRQTAQEQHFGGQRNSTRRSQWVTSSMTEFERNDSYRQPPANFARPYSLDKQSSGGRQDQQSSTIPIFPAPPSVGKSRPMRPPTLSLQIPSSGPPPVSLPPLPPMARPPLVREKPLNRVPRQPIANPILPDVGDSDYSPALPSSQVMGTATLNSSTGLSSTRSASSQRHSRESRDSQASFTSFESLGSDDDDPTPPREEERRLSPVYEMPAARVSYPKIPRSANQAVPRSPGSPKQRPDDSNTTTMPSPKRNAATTTPVKQSIGNRLWKTEISPQSERLLPGWQSQTEDWVWTPNTPIQIKNSPTQTGKSPTQIRNSPILKNNSPIQSKNSPIQNKTSPTQQAPLPDPPLSPFGAMPTLTPSRRGNDLFLSVN